MKESTIEKEIETDSSSEPKIKALLKNLDEIQPLPNAILEALNLSLNDDVDLESIARVIEADQALTLKFLKIANAASNTTSTLVSNIAQALPRLGLANVRFSLLGLIGRDFASLSEDSNQKLLQDIWAHSLACAVTAQLIAERTYPELKYEVFAAGILHDIGKNMITQALPDKYQEVLKYAEDNKTLSINAEHAVLNIDHAQVGKWLAQKWKLPENLINVIWLHHQPVDAIQFLDAEKEFIYIVMLADYLSHKIFFGQTFTQQYQAEYDKLPEKIGLSNQELDEISGEIASAYTERAVILDKDYKVGKVYEQTIKRANVKLSSMAVELEGNNRTLKKINKIARLSSNVATRISGAHVMQDVLDIMVDTFKIDSPYKVGFVYLVDTENRMLEGRYWVNSKQPNNFMCFLDSNNQPVWEGKYGNMPDGFSKIMATYSDRLPRKDIDQLIDEDISYFSPFYLAPISDEHICGEICIAPGTKAEFISSHEKAGLRQIARMATDTIRRIKLHEKLEKRSEDLSLALWKNQQINQQLVQHDRLAAVGQLAAGAAHEINNPLAIIYARSQLLHATEQEDKKKKDLMQMMEQIDRISGILTNLMDFARPSPPKLVDVNINTLLEKVTAFVKSGFRDKKIVIVNEFDPELPTIKADPSQLEQVFLNVSINARHAMEEKGGTLTISTKAGANGKTVKIKVTDEGQGIEAKNMDKIFDPFFTTKEEGKGTGLGLSTSYGIISNHFGNFDIKSDIGKGTTVTIDLPVDIESLSPKAKESIMSLKPKRKTTNPRILVVDDEMHIREIIKETLESENMTIDIASNGNEALEQLSEGKYDLMLMDIRMPVKDGLSVMSEISTWDNPVPTIIITGLATHEEMEEALSKGAYKCIRKPFHIKLLLKHIHEVLEKNK
ncbi:MAG: HDOD domain-containing protein [Desulfobacterales bacterium]|nr:HDOD domain-containing protein [Desulfobacterales bacterium]